MIKALEMATKETLSNVCLTLLVYEMGGLKVSDVYFGNDLADVQIASIFNKLHRLFYIQCYVLYSVLISNNFQIKN